MSFFGIFESLVQLLPLANQLVSLLSSLQQAQQEAKRELQEKLGREIEVYPVLLKTPQGTKIGIIVDLPGEVEGPLSILLEQAGIKFERYVVRQA